MGTEQAPRFAATVIAGRFECLDCGRMYDVTPDEPLPDFCSDDCDGEIARAAFSKALGETK